MDIIYPIRLLYRKLTSVYWQIALVDHCFPILQDNNARPLTFLDHTDNWFADPFIFDIRESEVDIIAEEFLSEEKKGVITMLTIRRSDNAVLSQKRILELDTHLSFPFVFRENGKVYIFPENSASGSHSAYELDSELNVIQVRKIVSEPLVDTAIIKVDGCYYLFGTKVPEENKARIRVYKASSLLDEYILYQEIAVDKATARGASGIYVLGGENHYFRIGQDNTGLYGRGLVFQEIYYDSISKRFSIVEKYRRYPNFADKGFVAMHTYNILGDTAVIDIKKYRYPTCAGLLNFVRYRK